MPPEGSGEKVIPHNLVIRVHIKGETLATH